VTTQGLETVYENEICVFSSSQLVKVSFLKALKLASLLKKSQTVILLLIIFNSLFHYDIESYWGALEGSCMVGTRLICHLSQENYVFHHQRAFRVSINAGVVRCDASYVYRYSNSSLEKLNQITSSFIT
jgi:hypothetical protein